MEVNTTPQQAQKTIAQIESADLVVSALVGLEADTIAATCDGLRSVAGSSRIVLLLSNYTSEVSSAGVEGPEAESTLTLLPWSNLRLDAGMPLQSISAAFQSLFEIGERLQARACCMIASQMEKASPQWISQLVQPLLDTDCDLVLPFYTVRKFHGLLNSSIVSPLTRCLYGKRIHNPLGPDAGVSRRLAQRVLQANRNGRPSSNQTPPLTSLVPTAVCENMQICQVHVGARHYPPTDWSSMSSLLSQVLGPIFLNMEKNASCWQRTRAAVPVISRGERLALPPEMDTLDLDRMVEMFQLAVRDLQEIWGLVLPPATLLELRKLSRLPPEKVLMPDELWARIVYDFALAHRLRTINRDHLLASMTPLYLAWVSSYAREVENARLAAIEQRLERLALAYETAKPYLVSRWRWPDRFNP